VTNASTAECGSFEYLYHVQIASLEKMYDGVEGDDGGDGGVGADGDWG